MIKQSQHMILWLLPTLAAWIAGASLCFMIQAIYVGELLSFRVFWWSAFIAIPFIVLPIFLGITVPFLSFSVYCRSKGLKRPSSRIHLAAIVAFALVFLIGMLMKDDVVESFASVIPILLYALVAASLTESQFKRLHGSPREKNRTSNVQGSSAPPPFPT
jgi:hypothetical protein